jgi:hypothetical protein
MEYVVHLGSARGTRSRVDAQLVKSGWTAQRETSTGYHNRRTMS